MRIEVDFSELEGVARLLDIAPKEATDVAHEVTKELANDMLRGAKADAPRDRPWLALHGYRMKTWRDRRGTHTDVMGVPDPEGRPVPFVVEYGTTDTPPNPVLGRQLERVGPLYGPALLARLRVLGER